MKKFVYGLLLGIGFILTACANSPFEQGMKYYNQKDYAQAFPLLEIAANQENAAAQYTLGKMYENGLGIDTNHTQAKELFEKAAAQGNAQAQFNLALMYIDGQWVVKDYAQAAKLLEASAAQGFVYAQNVLGFMHENGMGFVPDYAKAKHYYTLACNAELENACDSLDRLKAKGH